MDTVNAEEAIRIRIALDLSDRIQEMLEGPAPNDDDMFHYSSGVVEGLRMASSIVLGRDWL